MNIAPSDSLDNILKYIGDAVSPCTLDNAWVSLAFLTPELDGKQATIRLDISTALVTDPRFNIRQVLRDLIEGALEADERVASSPVLLAEVKGWWI